MNFSWQLGQPAHVFLEVIEMPSEIIQQRPAKSTSPNNAVYDYMRAFHAVGCSVDHAPMSESTRYCKTSTPE
jgi:hypothetical protein